MFVIVVYDINKKRVAKCHKICRKYLYPIQKSVFEGDISQKNLNQLKSELERNVEYEQDSICIYELDSQRYAHKLLLGVVEQNRNIL